MEPTKISQEDIEGWNSWSTRNTEKFIWDKMNFKQIMILFCFN